MKKFYNLQGDFLRIGFVSAVLWLAASHCASASVVLSGPLEPKYELQLTVQKNFETITGKQTVSFVNGDSQPIKNVWLRLWANGYGSCKHPRIRVQVKQGARAGAFETECTALNVVLSHAVEPGQRGSFELTFAVSVPHLKKSDRFGIEAKSATAMVGNAVPILAVTDQRGTHITEPFSKLGESFYSLSSQWHAYVTLPAGASAAMTGTTIKEETLMNKDKRIEVASKHARDFGLSVGHFDVDSTQQDNVEIRYFHLPAKTATSRKKVKRALNIARTAVKRFTTEYGPYGSPELDIAQSEGVAMEYPEMVMTVDTFPATITHEIAHQWWFGIVGNDEHYEPWLDESFAAYAEKQACRKDYFDKLTFPDDYHLTNTMTYFDTNESLYSSGVYGAGGCALHKLQAELGVQRMSQFLRSYVANHRFGVATTKDFLDELLAFSQDQPLVDRFISLARIQVQKPIEG